MKDIIKLNKVIYNIKARGEWCRLPYPGHKEGCPNTDKCIERRQDFHIIELQTQNKIDWYAVLEKFSLKKHAEKMKTKHPDWTEKQCRNLLYWQGGVRKRLIKKTFDFANKDTNTVIILDIPEASGVDVFKTMELHGIKLQRKKPSRIIKVMMVGKIRGI